MKKANLMLVVYDVCVSRTLYLLEDNEVKRFEMKDCKTVTAASSALDQVDFGRLWLGGNLREKESGLIDFAKRSFEDIGYEIEKVIVFFDDSFAGAF